jgi:hypothetical protein
MAFPIRGRAKSAAVTCGARASALETWFHGSEDLPPNTIVGVVTLKYEEIQDQRSSMQRRKQNWREKEKKGEKGEEERLKYIIP